MEIKGGCLCGAVRYTAEADPTSATCATAEIAKNSPAVPLPRWFECQGGDDHRGHTQNVQ
jgi:hypothetical protein